MVSSFASDPAWLFHSRCTAVILGPVASKQSGQMLASPTFVPVYY
jgi:hypothetical protein